MNWKTWLKGLVAAVVGGTASSVGVVIADPKYMSGEGYAVVAKVAAIGALTHLVLYLQKSPIPPDSQE